MTTAGHKTVEADIRNRAIELLHSENASCVIANGISMEVCTGRGVSDLFRILKSNPQQLSGAFVADKAVGKAAAAIMVTGKVKAVYTDLISLGALELLEQNCIDTSYAESVATIMNRDKTDFCPLEKLCADCHTAADCLPRIETFINNIKPKV